MCQGLEFHKLAIHHLNEEPILKNKILFFLTGICAHRECRLAMKLFEKKCSLHCAVDVNIQIDR